MDSGEWRVEMARAVFACCNGDVDRAMEHEKMPYKTKRAVQRLAKDHGWYGELGISTPKGFRRLNEEQIQRMRKAFIETEGSIQRTAQHAGFARSTVTKYAEKGGWREELLGINREIIDHEEGGESLVNGPLASQDAGESEEDGEGTIARLKTLRQLLFEQIIGDETSEPTRKPPLRIAPKTLSEAVKALLDVDKRISELAGTRPVAIWGPYQNVLSRCAEVAEGEPEP